MVKETGVNNYKISVLMPVYNGSAFLQKAVDSILCQTFDDFEFIIIDDGSTDNSVDILKSYQDPRIILLQNLHNLGLVKTLNRGLLQSRGKYIARMDQDDISFTDRLERQVRFLDNHPEHVLVGTTYAYINTQGEVTGSFPALLDDEDIKRELFTKTPFGHGTVMIRGSALRQKGFMYSEDAVHVEDYDLWLRFAQAGKYANLPEILYLWRYSSTNTKSLHGQTQSRYSAQLQKRAFDGLRDARILVKWPGWRSFRKYRNASKMVQGRHVEMRRRDAYCSMYLVLAWSFFRRRVFAAAIAALVNALCISPSYVFLALHKRLTLAK